MFRTHRGVKFGVVYYPEQWDKSLWQSDLARIRVMGVEEVRLMEFAWALLEPKKGVYDFSLFDEVLKLCEAEGLSVILGTPTATLPAWLYELDPTVVRIHPSGKTKDWGSRREACLNSPTYLKYADNIVEAVAKHFGKHPAVIGWQIDNEIGHEGSDICVCGHCRKVWHAWLKAKYKTIGALNAAWGCGVNRTDNSAGARAYALTGNSVSSNVVQGSYQYEAIIMWNPEGNSVTGNTIRYGELIDSMIRDGLWDVYRDVHMGQCGDQCAARYEFSRQAQDDFAIASYKRAIQASAAWPTTRPMSRNRRSQSHGWSENTSKSARSDRASVRSHQRWRRSRPATSVPAVRCTAAARGPVPR